MRVTNAINDYLSSPDAATVALLREAIVEHESFQRTTPWAERAERLMSQERHDEVIRLLEALMPGLWLSPVAHAMLAVAYQGIGRDEDARRERFYWRAAIDAILDFGGDGSMEAPWPVLQVPDMYEALGFLRLTPVGQRSVDVSGTTLDAIECSDGGERWFELVGLGA